MRLALFLDGFDLSSVLGSDPSGVGERILLSGCWGLAEPGHVRPLLDGFVKVVEVQGFVVGSVPQLHSRSGSGEAWVSVANQVTPLGRGFGGLAIRARRVPCGGSGKAGERNTGECSTGLEDVGVGTNQDVGHHATRAVAGDEDTVGVGRIFGDGVADHVSDGEGVTTAIVGESGGRGNIPAASRDDRVGIASSSTKSQFDIRVLAEE